MTDDSLITYLNLLDQYVSDLLDARPSRFDIYQQDKMLRRYTERMLHMAADTVIRIGINILTQEGYRNPENYHDVFIVLGEHGIFERDIVDCMTAVVEFRNLLVYEHEAVDDMMVYGFVKKRLNDFTCFTEAVRQYINQRADTESLPKAKLDTTAVYIDETQKNDG